MRKKLRKCVREGGGDGGRKSERGRERKGGKEREREGGGMEEEGRETNE